jgi:hypothetical protein
MYVWVPQVLISNCNFVCASYFSLPCYMLCSAHPWSEHQNIFQRGVQIKKLLIMRFSPSPCHLFSFGFRHFPEHDIVKRRECVLGHIQDFGVDGRIILKWILIIVWIYELNWSDSGFSGGVLWTRLWNFGFHKNRSTSWVAIRLLAFHGVS